MPADFGAMTTNVKVTECTNVKFASRNIPYNVLSGTETCLALVWMPFDFGVAIFSCNITDCKKVKITIVCIKVKFTFLWIILKGF